jgi:hypothetical protein
MTNTFDINTPWTLEQAHAASRTATEALHTPYITLMGGNRVDVYQLDNDEYLVLVVSPEGECRNYGILDKATFAQLRERTAPISVDDHAYPQAMNDAMHDDGLYVHDRRVAHDDDDE